MSRTSSAPAAVALTEGGMTHREVLDALSGLLLGMFVSMLATTVVGTSLPLIIADLDGDQCRVHLGRHRHPARDHRLDPDLGQARRPLRPQAAGPARARHLRRRRRRSPGFAQDPAMLIAMRVFQGLGAGGLAALGQIVMADILSPRERGRYAGLFGAVMAVGTIGGPLLGGVITDTLGWRWNFFVGVPFAIVALVAAAAHAAPADARRRRRCRSTTSASSLIAGGVSLLLIWVSLGGSQFDWDSWQTALHGRRRPWRCSRSPWSSSCASKEPLIPLGLVQQPHVHALGRRQHRGRRRDVRHLGVPQPVHAARPRRDADRVRPADHPDDRRPAHRRRPSSARSSRAAASGSRS